MSWIKLHRDCFNNWMYKEDRPHTKREAWEDILLLVNYEDRKVLIGERLIECKRGQSLKSLDTWARHFKWNKSKVRRFFKLLESDSMIVTENLHKTTRLTVCNYASYQDKRHADETQVKRKRNASETQVTPIEEIKELKEIKEGIERRKLKFAESLKPFLEKYGKEMIRAFYEHWSQHGEKDKKMLFEKQKSFGVSQRLSTWSRNEKKWNRENPSQNKGGYMTAKQIMDELA